MKRMEEILKETAMYVQSGEVSGKIAEYKKLLQSYEGSDKEGLKNCISILKRVEDLNNQLKKNRSTTSKKLMFGSILFGLLLVSLFIEGSEARVTSVHEESYRTGLGTGLYSIYADLFVQDNSTFASDVTLLGINHGTGGRIDFADNLLIKDNGFSTIRIGTEPGEGTTNSRFSNLLNTGGIINLESISNGDLVNSIFTFNDSEENNLGLVTGGKMQFRVGGVLDMGMDLEDTGLDVSGNLTGNVPYGEMHWNHNAIETTINTQFVWENISVNASGPLNGVVYNFNESYLMVEFNGTYLVSNSGSLSNGGNNDFEVTIAVNDKVKHQCMTRRTISAGAGDLGVAATTCILPLTANDRVNMQTRNLDGTGNPTFNHATVTVSRLGS